MNWDLVHFYMSWGFYGYMLGYVLGVPLNMLLGIECCCTMPLTLAALGVAAAVASGFLKVDITGKAVLITGCDTGFGHMTSLRLADMGFTVFSGCLDDQSEGAKRLAKSPKIHVISMNVTKDEDVDKAFDYVKKNLPSKGLWGIVNNAGVGALGDAEFTSMKTFAHTLDVNGLGVVRVTRKFIPLLRKTKGRVVLISSVAGRCALPSLTAYTMSKYVVQGFGDCLRYEMRLFDIDVSIVEPGNFASATGILKAPTKQDILNSMSEEMREAYGEDRVQQRVTYLTNAISNGETDVSPVLDSYVAALTERFPRKRYQPADPIFKVAVFLNTHLPEWVYEGVMRNLWTSGAPPGMKV